MKRFPIFLFLFLTFFPASALFAEQLACPDKIMVRESVTDTPEGWMPVLDGNSHPLKDVAFFDGNPEKLVRLVPDKDFKKKGYLYSVWRFDAKTAKNLWMSCTYGQTAMTFARPLHKVYSRCTAKSELEITVDGVPSLVSIECK